MTVDVAAELEDGVYETCPVCQGDDSGCVWCDGLGLVPHDCLELREGSDA